MQPQSQVGCWEDTAAHWVQLQRALWCSVVLLREAILFLCLKSTLNFEVRLRKWGEQQSVLLTQRLCSFPMSVVVMFPLPSNPFAMIDLLIHYTA